MKNYNETSHTRLRISVISLAALIFSLSISCSHSVQKKPNVLFIAVDDLNDWVGCLGGHPNTLTPNIDRLAKSSMVFQNAHCQAPICGPSRASVMTGLLPSTSGIYGWVEDDEIRESNTATRACTYLPEYFKQNGYKTMGIGKLFHRHAPKRVFDISGGRESGFGPKPKKRMKWEGKRGPDFGGTSTDWGAFPEHDWEMPDYKSAQWAKARLVEKHDNPFFLAIGFIRPHVPWHVPQKWFDMFPVEQLETPPYLPKDLDDIPEIGRAIADLPMMPTTEWAIKNTEWKNIVQAYLASISFVDHYVGEVLNALEQSIYSDNTIIVLWSDHGYHIGEKNRFGKFSLWEEATRAPLIISAPGFKKGQVCKKPVGMIDIYPTLLDLCGFEPNTQNEGHSLKPLLLNSSMDWPHVAITTYGPNNHAIRGENYRYIRYENGSEELYDHRNDDDEWYNLADESDYGKEKLHLKQYLPKINEPWAPTSRNNYNKYFNEQTIRESE